MGSCEGISADSLWPKSKHNDMFFVIYELQKAANISHNMDGTFTNFYDNTRKNTEVKITWDQAREITSCNVEHGPNSLVMFSSQ